MTRPHLAILPPSRTFTCRKCPAEVVYPTDRQPPPGAAYRLCQSCNDAELRQHDPDVLTDEAADVRTWQTTAIIDDLLDAPTFIPDLEF